ncbi:hypothetical protein GE061_020236 [Apolygus lucorum]|uniref:Uncharacterized protein n=1 Tax=Apolygus lucorum TaxID=248454 RepID=A0A8S9WNI8_APOLU|nr:hypothetical protein GE061_020236 [Apolygus lucorum]
MVLIQRFSGVKCLYAESCFLPSNPSSSPSSSANDRGRLTFIWRKHRIIIDQKEFNEIYPQLRDRIPLILNANKKKRIDLVVIFSTERMAMSTINSKNGVRRSLGIYLRSIPLNLIPFSRPELQVFYNLLPEIHALVNRNCEEKEEEEDRKDAESQPAVPPQEEEEEEGEKNQKADIMYSPLSPQNAYDRGE